LPTAGVPNDEGDVPRAGGAVGGGRIRRAAPLAGLTARVLGEALRGDLGREHGTEFHVRTAERYAELLGRSKGALMKVGQMLSFTALGSAVPKELQSIYQEALAGLRNEAPPMTPKLARATLEAELSGPAERNFSEFDWEPIAAASIGQVHAAQLHDGRQVAVKIQYPGVGEAIRADLRNAELLAAVLGVAVGSLSSRGLKLDLRSMAAEVSVRVEEELDYRIEASNQAEFADHYRGHPFIRVPEVIGELSTDRVLTQQLVQGHRWSEALLAEQSLRDQWAEAIHRFVYGSYYRLGLFNTDPHPGNFIFHDDGSVSFLDFGSVKRLRRERIELLVAIYRECLRGDVQGTWRASVEAGMWRSTDPVTADEIFAYWREDNPLVWATQRFVATPENVGRGIERRFSPAGPSANALRYCTMPADYALLARAEIGAMSVIAQLQAGNDWRSFALEYCEDAAPLTAMGKREHAFLERREQDRVLEQGGTR
jgi:predicted unusual protein kinase regulating ubiquinone biosynthesis (AarF/ABC1/UbiB family)